MVAGSIATHVLVEAAELVATSRILALYRQALIQLQLALAAQ